MSSGGGQNKSVFRFPRFLQHQAMGFFRVNMGKVLDISMITQRLTFVSLWVNIGIFLDIDKENEC